MATWNLCMRHTPQPVVDIGVAIPEFASLARTAVRLHPRRGQCPVSDSKIGGLILWPQQEEWPICKEHGSPFVAVLQLRAEDVPELGFRERTDLFQLLWCPNDHEETLPRYAPATRVFWRKHDGIKQYLATPPAPVLHPELGQAGCRHCDYCPKPCVLHPERVLEYPDAFEVADNYPHLWQKIENSKELQEAVEAIGEYDFHDPGTLYQYWLSVAAGTKVSGYPEWVQDPELPKCRCGSEMDYLLTVASAEFDGGTWGRWLAEEESHVWGADYEVRNAVQRAANIMLGDMGILNYFVCRKCNDWPISSVLQCS